MSNLFNRFSWGGSGGGGGGGAGRGGHPPRRPLGHGASRPSISFEDEHDYDTANDGREYGGGRYSHRRGLSDSEYEARRTSIFNPEGYLNDGGRGGGQPMPPTPPAWQGQQGMGQPTATHPQGPQGLSIPPAPPVWQGMQASGLPIAAHTQGLLGQYGLPAAPGPIGVGAPAPLATPTPLAPGNQQGTQQGGAPLAPQAPGTQQGGAQIAVQPPGGGGAGPARTPTGIGANAPSSQESSGIAGALDRLAPYKTDADTSRSLRWQQNVNGDAAKIALW